MKQVMISAMLCAGLAIAGSASAAGTPTGADYLVSHNQKIVTVAGSDGGFIHHDDSPPLEHVVPAPSAYGTFGLGLLLLGAGYLRQRRMRR